ncbi:MAG: 50S ribosomal protein L24 [Cytophagales bacterium]|nr:50S ribosomal protein L24 [Armatimonadota bacterium]
MRKTPKPFEGKLRIKTGDTVQVIAGKDKGRTGKVTRVLPKAGKVIVEDLNIVIKHTKGQPTPTEPNPQSGRLEVAAPILVSKVALLNAEGKPTRARYQLNEDGTKTRIAARGGAPIAAPEKP